MRKEFSELCSSVSYFFGVVLFFEKCNKLCETEQFPVVFSRDDEEKQQEMRDE